MVVKLGDRNLHTGNIMQEDDAMSSAIDSFWGVKKSATSKAKHVTRTINTKSETPSEESATPKEIKKNDCISNISTKNQNYNTDNLKNIWNRLLQLYRQSEIKSILDSAEPYKLDKGVFMISVRTKFTEDCIMQYKQDICKALHEIDTQIVNIKVSTNFNILFYVRTHNNIIANKNISNATFRVYCALLTYRNNSTKECRIGIRQLIRDFAFCPGTLASAFKVLETEGYIKREERKNIRFPLLETTEKGEK